MHKEIDNKRVRGISGPDNICTLHPFEVVEIIDEPQEPEQPDEGSEEKEDLFPQPPTDKKLVSFVDWLIKVLTRFKQTL